MADSTDVFLPDDQFWVIAIGSVMPVATYFQNKLWPGASEPVKAFVQALVSGLVGGLFAVIAKDVHGFANIAQQCFSAIIASFFAHNILWKPANVNVRIGARPAPNQTPVRPEEDGGSSSLLPTVERRLA